MIADVASSQSIGRDPVLPYLVDGGIGLDVDRGGQSGEVSQLLINDTHLHIQAADFCFRWSNQLTGLWDSDDCLLLLGCREARQNYEEKKINSPV